MIDAATRLWLALWTRAAPRAKAPAADLIVTPFVSGAPMRALLAWEPDWKTESIGRVLRHRQGTLIDVGANVGQTLLDFLSAPVRSTYLGFEPNPTCYQHLVKFMSLNALHMCRVVPAALGDRNGVSTLYRYGGDVDAGATMLRQLRPRLAVVPDATCVLRLDDIADQLPEPQVALVKIDVEGTELEALRGMQETLTRTKPWILCEVLHRDGSAEIEPYRRRCSDLIQLVKRMNYEVFWIRQDPHGVTIRGLEPVAEFPDTMWDDEASAHACDYLFVPAAESGAARELLEQ